MVIHHCPFHPAGGYRILFGRGRPGWRVHHQLRRRRPQARAKRRCRQRCARILQVSLATKTVTAILRHGFNAPLLIDAATRTLRATRTRWPTWPMRTATAPKEDICPWRPKCRWWSKPKLPPLPRCLKWKLPLPPHHCRCLTLAELCQLLTTCRLPSATATAWLTRSTTATLTTTTDSHTSTKLLLLLILAHALIGCLITHLVLLTDWIWLKYTFFAHIWRDWFLVRSE